MAPNVLSRTADELRARRDALLSSIGMTREELQAKADAYVLSGAEYEVLSRVQDVEFLLGGE